MQDLTEVTRRFHAIAERVLTANEVDADPWFAEYLGSTRSLAGAAKYVRQQADLLAYAWPAHDRPVVVDAGAGFGFSLIVAVLLGARAARGVELNPSMVATATAYLPLLPDAVRSRVEIIQGDVSEMPYDGESADIILSLEAISHYLDVDRFLVEARRVLAPGGVLVISDGNNGANPATRRITHEIWAAAEQGPAGSVVHGHRLGTPYQAVRQALLEQHLPELSAQQRLELAQRTAGYTEGQLLAAGREALAGAPMPDSVYRHGQLAAAPDGTVMERLFVPGELAARIRSHGFEAKAYGYWGGAGERPWVRLANRLLTSLTPLTVPTAKSFRVVARKPGPRQSEPQSPSPNPEPS